jgi:TRAP-type mannitol/chloroaromatic compound transport system permease small subunit
MGWPSAEVIAAYGDLIRALQWPIVALIVVGFFRQEIKEISRRLKRGKLLGNEFDLSDEIQQAKSDIQASESK